MEDYESNPLFDPRCEDEIPRATKHLRYLGIKSNQILEEKKAQIIANLKPEVKRISEKAITILKGLKEKHVKTYENEEVMGFKWKKVHIELPAVWEFKWYNFDYFVSYNNVRERDLDSNPELRKKSFSMEKICEILKNINNYMKAMGVKTDWDMNYKYELDRASRQYFGASRCKAWDCLKFITWLNKTYYLSDDIWLAYYIWLACFDTRFFFRTMFRDDTHLLLDLSQI